MSNKPTDQIGVNVYDFDHTIYDGDSTIDFYFYCLRRKPQILRILPVQLIHCLLFILKLESRTRFKSHFLSFIRYLPCLEEDVNKFWKKNETKIKKWYLNQKNATDIIISASPRFLLNFITEQIGVSSLIATETNEKGEIVGQNCYGEEKLRRFKAEHRNIKIENFYTDSLSDKPLINIADFAFIVKKNKLVPYRSERSSTS